MKKLLICLFLTFGSFSISLAQITITPTNVFVNNETRFGSYMVINGSDQAQEISIDFVFGYTKLEEGNPAFVYADSTARAEKFSAAPWVRAFPKNFILQPGERQTIRLRITSPNNLPDRMYWARIRTSSSPQSPAVGETADNDAITARVGIEVEQVTSLYYQMGDVNTGITIQQLGAKIDQNSVLWLIADIERTGNAPFLGSVYTTVYNENNEKVAQSVVATTLYFGGTIKRPVDVSGLPSGDYTGRIRFETHRSDIPDQHLVQMQPAEQSTSFTIE